MLASGMSDESEITVLLNQWAAGDENALDQLSPIIYNELKKIARRAFAGEADNHTLQPTILVNEVFIKLINTDISWQNRAHFYALTARMMRRLLINHANVRAAGKRGGKVIKVSLNTSMNDEVSSSLVDTDTNLIAINEALEDLSRHDSRKAELIELQYFAGLSFSEMVEVTQIPLSTLERELRFAKAWLKSYLTKS